MPKNKNSKYWRISLAVALCLFFLPAKGVFAQPSQTAVPAPSACGQADATPYTALYQAAPDTYDVYVRLGVQGQVAPVSLSYQGFSSDTCQSVGTVTAGADRWAKVGQWESKKGADAGTFSLTSTTITSLPNANRPTVMLVSKTHPACQPTDECIVTVAGKQGVVRASGTLLNEDSLHVVTAVDPKTDTVQSVDHYVDNRPVYKTATFSDFDLRYVGAGEHKLTTVITYDSKQKVIFSQSIDRGFADELNHLVFSFLYGQRTVLQIVAALAAVVIVWALVLAIIRRLYKRHLWKQHHFAQAGPAVGAPQQATLPQPNVYKPPSTARQVATWALRLVIVAAISVCLVATLVTFVAQPYQVDGPSMQSTLVTGDYLLVNRLPQTWAHLAGKKYIPKRGEIIVAKKEISPFLDAGSANGEFVVKRVIGLPGDTVVIRQGVVTVYPAGNAEPISPDVTGSWSKAYHPSDQDTLNLRLEPGELFIVGDNRPESVDSRSYGAIRSENVVGRAVLRALPISQIQRL